MGGKRSTTEFNFSLSVDYKSKRCKRWGKEQKTNKTFYFNDSSDTFKLRTIKRVRFRSRAIRNANQKSSSHDISHSFPEWAACVCVYRLKCLEQFKFSNWFIDLQVTVDWLVSFDEFPLTQCFVPFIVTVYIFCQYT